LSKVIVAPTSDTFVVMLVLLMTGNYEAQEWSGV